MKDSMVEKGVKKDKKRKAIVIGVTECSEIWLFPNDDSSIIDTAIVDVEDLGKFGEALKTIESVGEHHPVRIVFGI